VQPYETLDSYKARYSLDFSDIHSLPAQIKSYFFKTLRRHLKETQPDANFNEYVNAFYLSGFNTKFQDSAVTLADQSLVIYNKRQPTVEATLDNLLDDSFAQLLDRFLIYHCQDMNGIEVPKSIMKYEGLQANEFDLNQLAVDYLDINKSNNSQQFYTDIEQLSPTKLQNAREHFFYSQPNEQFILFYDQTIYGSGREGFALTDQALYWKHHFKQAQQVHFQELKIIDRQKDSLNINNLYFNVSPAINTKVLLLLKKLKEVSV